MKENWRNNHTWWLLLALPLLLLVAGCTKGDSQGHAEGEVYTCPMHPEVVQKGPGTCPQCKMDLVKRENTSDASAKAASGEHQHGEEAVYTCPMHPGVKQDKPGSCPICGMDLVKQGGAGGSDSVATELGDLLRPVNQAVVSSIETVHPEQAAREMTVELPGTVEYDTRRINAVASRFSGRIEKLYVRYNYQPVTKGQKLLEVYSPQLVEAQQELIFLLTRDAENTSLIDGAKRKLSLLGLSPGQIKGVVATRKPQYKVAVYSPYNGYVVQNLPAAGNAAGAAVASPAPAAGGMGGGGAMGGMNAATTATAPLVPAGSQAGSTLAVTEGAYVTAGQPVFRVVNTDQVWAVFQAYPATAGSITKGQPIQVIPENTPDEPLRGRVGLVEPFYRNGQNTATVRVPLSNPGGRLRSGMLLTGKLAVKTDSGLWLPREAVLDLGNRQVAFVRRGNSLQPVAIQAGLQNGEWIQVLKGLTAGDAVARNAQYLIDNEAFVRVDARQD